MSSIKYLLLAGALSFGLAGPALAQGSGGGDGGGSGSGAGSDSGASGGTGGSESGSGGTGAGTGTGDATGGTGTGTSGTGSAAGTGTGGSDSGAGTGAAGIGGAAGSGAAGAETGMGATGTAGAMEIPVKDLVGRDVVGTDGETLGEIEEVVYDPQGRVSRVILQVGGILGIGSKTVAVERSQIQGDVRGTADQPLRVGMTKEQLENAPAYDAEAETGVRMGN